MQHEIEPYILRYLTRRYIRDYPIMLYKADSEKCTHVSILLQTEAEFGDLTSLQKSLITTYSETLTVKSLQHQAPLPEAFNKTNIHIFFHELGKIRREYERKRKKLFRKMYKSWQDDSLRLQDVD